MAHTRNQERASAECSAGAGGSRDTEDAQGDRAAGSRLCVPLLPIGLEAWTHERRAWLRILDRAEIEDVRIHDLRRTMGSWQARTGASMIVIGKSLGHKSQQATAVYARLDLDPVRQSMEAATSAMLQAAGLKQPAEVTPITEGNAKRKQG